MNTIHSDKTINNAIILSDLHFEWDLKTKNLSSYITEKKADAIFLAGDIAGGTHAVPFIEHLTSLGYLVFYTLGNHEFYGHSIDNLINEWTKIDIENFYFLNDSVVEFENLRIYGTTLWASADTLKPCPVELYKKTSIDYFNRLKLKNWADFDNIHHFNIDEMSNLFWKHFDNLNTFLNEKTDKKTIIMSHFLPTFASVSSKFIGATSNCVFASELAFLMQIHKIDFWVHGHTHDSKDYFLDNTRIICNPRGYKDINALNNNFDWINIVDF